MGNPSISALQKEKDYVENIVGSIQRRNENNLDPIRFYDDENKYLKAIQEELEIDPNGFYNLIYSSNKKFIKEVYDSIYGFMGYDTPDEFCFYDELQDDTEQTEKRPNGAIDKKNPSLISGVAATSTTLIEDKKVLTIRPEKSQKTFKDGPYYQKNIYDMLKVFEKGEAPFLPESGQCKPVVIRSAITGYAFRGANQLLAQVKLSERNIGDTSLITYKEAQELGSFIKKGSASFVLTTFDGKSGYNAYHYFPSSAVDNSSVLPKFDFRKTPDKRIVCTEAIPEQYIGRYLAASATGATFKTSPEIVESFRKNMVRELKGGIENYNHVVLFKIGNRASEVCRSILKEISLSPPERHRPQERQPAHHPQQGTKTYESGYIR